MINRLVEWALHWPHLSNIEAKDQKCGIFLCIGDRDPVHPQPLESCGPLHEENAFYMPHHNQGPRYTGWSKDGKINTACIMGPYRDNGTHFGRGYASVGTKNV